MSTLPPLRRRAAPGSVRPAACVAVAITFGAAGWLVASVSDAALVSVTAAAALSCAVLLVVMCTRARILTSPLMILAVPLLLSLAAAMLPITRIFSAWSLGTLGVVVLIVAAPVAGVGAAIFLAHGRLPRLERGTTAMPHSRRLVVTCVLMCVAGSVVYAIEWSSIGGPPLLSSNIDEARFSLIVEGVHVFTEGLPLAMLIATWARVGRAQSFTWLQRRTLEAIIGYVPLVLALGGGRSVVLLPLVTALVVAARYVSPRAGRRMLVVIPVAILVFSSAIFLARLGQQASNPVLGTVILYSDTGTKTTPHESAYRALSINFGEQLRVIQELHDANITSPPFTSSIWFAHIVSERAVDPHKITGPNAGGWLTSSYAGPLLLDFGLIPALLFGFVLGAAAHMLYLRFAAGRSVTVIWIYAYLAGPVALAFYINTFLYFVYPIIDLIVLTALSRLLIMPAARVAEPARRLAVALR